VKGASTIEPAIPYRMTSAIHP